jgi:hypothetical protein
LKSSSGNKSNLNVGACPNFSSSSALASTLASASASASALILSLEDFFEDFLVRNFTNFSI